MEQTCLWANKAAMHKIIDQSTPPLNLSSLQMLGYYFAAYVQNEQCFITSSHFYTFTLETLLPLELKFLRQGGYCLLVVHKK